MEFNFDIIGVWLLVLMTLSILSYLYGDNPFYKAAEHIFVGVSAGYIFALTWWDQVWPNLFGRLFPTYVDAGFEFSIIYLIPLILGIFMLLRLVPSLSWLARISIGYIVGMAAGLKIYVFINSNILMQIHLAEADFQLNKLKNIEKAKSKLKERRSEIFEKNNTTSKIFNNTLDHYSKKPEDLDIIYTEIIDDLQNKKSTLQ